MAKKYLRKAAVCERYGGITPRTVDRMVVDGRLPEPEYRGRWPIWDEQKLDEADRAATAAQRPKRTHGRDTAAMDDSAVAGNERGRRDQDDGLAGDEAREDQRHPRRLRPMADRRTA
jgi:hypothetical protein